MSPGAGATIGESGTVRIHYAGYSASATSISGYLLLNGIWAGSFTRAVTGPPANGTAFNATLSAANFSGGGAYTLHAHVFTDVDAPVNSSGVPVLLDLRPKIALGDVTYDLDARDLVVATTISDEGPSAPLVTLRSGANATNTSFIGTQTIRLDAPRQPGTYNASVSAKDALGQNTTIGFTYAVLDREATLSVSHVAYELGGKLRLRGNVSDPDGLQGVRVNTPLGSGDATLLGNGTEWSALIGITPALGTFTGFVESRDVWNGTTRTSFTFTIDGTNVTVFERRIVTNDGVYANDGTIQVPGTLGGVIEIDVREAAGPADLSSTLLDLIVTPSLRGAVAAAYNVTCAQEGSTQCRQLTGRWGQQGAFDLCADSPPRGNIVGGFVYSAWRAVDNATTSAIGGSSTCRNLFDDINATADATGPSDPGEGNQTAAVAIIAQRYGNGPVICKAIGGSTTCAFEAPHGMAIDLRWAQAAGYEVTVRIVGVRV